MDPFADVFSALRTMLSKSSEVRAIADVSDPDRGVNATERRRLDDGDRVRMNLVPAPGGSVDQISSSHTRIIERFRITPTAGHLSHSQVMSLKFAVIKTVWRKRNLGLPFVERTDVDTIRRESAVGTQATEDETWTTEIEIAVSMLLDRSQLKMA